MDIGIVAIAARAGVNHAMIRYFFGSKEGLLVRVADPLRVKHVAEGLLQPIAHAQARIIAEGVASGAFRPIDPKLFYFNTIGAADGLYSNRFTLSAVFGGIPNADPEMHIRYREQTVEILLRGLLA
ncbi:TetR family transcriptional regulator [Sandaracinobacteroides hominis]|uniref:TetR family transcriptional regulator n=1 Tax=Sandaracinobacteroides hominis TaxID=2780086 RepID=UPI0018F37A81|nr:TetR family transcriptional regulator [Sandaracinobacteroides hominis]